MADNTGANNWIRGRSGKQAQQAAMPDDDVARLAVELLAAAKGDQEQTARVEADLARLAPHMFGRAASGSADGGAQGQAPRVSAGAAANDFIRTESARR